MRSRNRCNQGLALAVSHTNSSTEILHGKGNVYGQKEPKVLVRIAR